MTILQLFGDAGLLACSGAIGLGSAYIASCIGRKMWDEQRRAFYQRRNETPPDLGPN